MTAVKDYQGITIHLTSYVWNDKILDPVFGHPEVKPYKNQVAATISDPDTIYQSTRESRSKLFLKQIVTGQFSGYYLLVVVKYVIEESRVTGYVSTVFITNRLPKKDKLLWQKAKLST